MGEISLYARALSDFKAGKILFAHVNVDDNIVDIIGYHLQQSVEKLLKFQIEIQGGQFPFTHDIAVLADLVGEVPNWILENIETLTKYGVKTRYSSVRIASIKVLETLYDKLEIYLCELKPEEDASFKYNPKF